MTRRRALALAATLTTFAGIHAAPAEAAPERAKCARAKAPGGQWRTFGHDLANTRTQRAERKIGPAQAPLLAPEWTFSTDDVGASGDVTGTPTVAAGCVFFGTNDGWLFALNAKNGRVVWKRRVPYGGGVNSSATVNRRRVYFAVARTAKAKRCRKKDPCVGPYVIALRRKSGRVIWATRSLDRQPGSDVYASPVVFGRTLMIGISGGAAELGDEADRYAFQGSMVFLDTRKGRRLRKTWTIHRPGRPKDDFAGAGVWSTPAVDRKRGVAYAGTANPFRPQAEHGHSNAIVKYNVRRGSPRFGKIVNHYKGNVDEYYPGLSEMPCFDIPGNPPPYYPQGIGSCGDIDLDFGASPNLVRIGHRRLVGAGQKSGVYHLVDRRTMKPVWTTVLGPPTAVGGIVGSTAYDGRGIYGPLTVPGYLWSVSSDFGSVRWATPIGDGVHWGNPVAVANGVVYTTNFSGFLDAYDRETGVLLARHRLPQPTWGGVSIARHTVYAAVGIRGLEHGQVVAFRVGGQDSGGGGGGGGGGGDGGADPGSNPPIVAGPGAASAGYATPVATTEVGGELSFTNIDLAQHDVTSDELGPGGLPVFSTPLIGLGQTAEVRGLGNVVSGRTYGFFCTLHPGMRGQLAVR